MLQMRFVSPILGNGIGYSSVWASGCTLAGRFLFPPRWAAVGISVLVLDDFLVEGSTDGSTDGSTEGSTVCCSSIWAVRFFLADCFLFSPRVSVPCLGDFVVEGSTISMSSSLSRVVRQAPANPPLALTMMICRIFLLQSMMQMCLRWT